MRQRSTRRFTITLVTRCGRSSGISRFLSRRVDSASAFLDFLCASCSTGHRSGRRQNKQKNSFTKLDQIVFQSQVVETYDRKTLARERVAAHSPVFHILPRRRRRPGFILAHQVHLSASKDVETTEIRDHCSVVQWSLICRSSA